MKKPKAEEGGGIPEYMATYADLVTLLMCFFVLLFSMSVVDKQKFIEIANSMRSSLTSISGGSALLSNQGQSILTIVNTNTEDTGDKTVDNEKYVQKAEEMAVDAEEIAENKEMDEVKQELRSLAAEGELSEQMEVIEEKDWLLIRLDSALFFESGSASIKEEGKQLLTDISSVLETLEGRDILVQGHTDNVAIKTATYSSNWELSTARATNVVKFIVESLNVDPAMLTATGNAEFRPIGDNATEEGRRQNRRIEIKVLK